MSLNDVNGNHTSYTNNGFRSLIADVFMLTDNFTRRIYPLFDNFDDKDLIKFDCFSKYKN